jgi:tripartite-type tricarboxylate transporter receptor subunit TctC
LCFCSARNPRFERGADFEAIFNVGTTMNLTYRLLVALAAACLPFFGHGQEAFPAKPITLVSGFPPAGPADIVPRQVAAALSRIVKAQVVVENKPGANGNIAATYVAQSRPDGYTLYAMSGGTMTANQWLYSKPPLDPLKAFTAVTVVAASPNVLVVNPAVKVSSVKELIELAKARPGELFYGTPGVGSSPHLSGESLKIEAGNINIAHVPYKGGGPALADLLAGRLQVGFSTPSLLLPYIKTGRLKALAVTSKTRSALLPDVPTMAEAGLANYEVLGWYGVAAPAGTPEPVMEWLHTALDQVLKDSTFKSAMADLGFTVVGKNPKDTAQDIAAEAEKWRNLIRKLNIRLD